MVPVHAVGGEQVAVGPVVHPLRPVEVAPVVGGLVEPQAELRTGHVGDRVAVVAPARLGPEDPARVGVGRVGIPAGDHEGEDLPGPRQRRTVTGHQELLRLLQPDPLVVVVEHVAAAAVGRGGVGVVAGDSGRAAGGVPVPLLAGRSIAQGRPERRTGASADADQVERRDVGLGERPLVGVLVVARLHRVLLVVEVRAVADVQVLLQGAVRRGCACRVDLRVRRRAGRVARACGAGHRPGTQRDSNRGQHRHAP